MKLLFLLIPCLTVGCKIDDGAISGPYCDDEQFADDPCKCYQIEDSPPCEDTGISE